MELIGLEKIYESEHFRIKYSEPDESCILDVVTILEDEYSRIVETYKEEYEKRIDVEIYHEHSDLLSAIGVNTDAKWIRGGLNGRRILVASPLKPPFGADYASVVATVVHEFIHMVLSLINVDIPKWLDEGVASYEAKDNNDGWIRGTIKEGIVSKCFPTLDELDTGEDFELFFAKNGYQYSYSIVEFIIEEFGYDKCLQLLETPDNFEDVLGMKKKEFEVKWFENCEAKYS